MGSSGTEVGQCASRSIAALTEGLLHIVEVSRVARRLVAPNARSLRRKPRSQPARRRRSSAASACMRAIRNGGQGTAANLASARRSAIRRNPAAAGESCRPPWRALRAAIHQLHARDGLSRDCAGAGFCRIAGGRADRAAELLQKRQLDPASARSPGANGRPWLWRHRKADRAAPTWSGSRLANAVVKIAW